MLYCLRNNTCMFLTNSKSYFFYSHSETCNYIFLYTIVVNRLNKKILYEPIYEIRFFNGHHAGDVFTGTE